MTLFTNMNQIEIKLHTALTQDESYLLARYLRNRHRFSRPEWQMLRAIIGQLERSQVVYQKRRLTFKQFYKQMIDRPYAHAFLQQLYNLTNIMQEGPKLQAATNKKIIQWLRQAGFVDTQTDYASYLVAYCLYWWGAFARGYIFELFVFRDLEASGINFKPHDPRLLSERYAKHDLVVGNWKGDVKLSLYFVSEAQAPPLDFYITRIYNPHRRAYQLVVLMEKSAWKQINGYTFPGRLAFVLSVLRQPIHLRLGQEIWVLSLFEDWKQRIKKWQGVK